MENQQSSSEPNSKRSRGRKKLIDNQKRKLYPVYLNEEEFIIIQQKATKHKMDLSVFMRKCALEQTVSTPKHASNTSSFVSIEHTKLLIDLNKSAVNLNQMLKHLNSKRIVFSDEALQIVYDLRKDVHLILDTLLKK